MGANDLLIDSVTFVADSLCPFFPDIEEGRYGRVEGLDVAQVALGMTDVSGDNIAESCVTTTLTLQLRGSLKRERDEHPLEIHLSSIVLSGEFISRGQMINACPGRCGDGAIRRDRGEICDGESWCNEECRGVPPGLCESTQRGCPDLDFLPIHGGRFSMGSDSSPNEQPIHDVIVPSFDMMRAEVTVGQYQICVEENYCSPPRSGTNYNWGVAGRENHPINGVSWIQLDEFSRWVGARLPTEAEWEYAARNQGQEMTYPWGNQPPSSDLVVYGTAHTAPVCSKPNGNTAQGLCDMAGNVWEWVQDEWHPVYEDAPEDGSAWCTENADCLNTNSVSRIRRGGGWGSNADYLRVAYRNHNAPTNQGTSFGVRLVRSR